MAGATEWAMASAASSRLGYSWVWGRRTGLFLAYAASTRWTHPFDFLCGKHLGPPTSQKGLLHAGFREPFWWGPLISPNGFCRKASREELEFASTEATIKTFVKVSKK